MRVIKAIGHAIVFIFDGFARFCAFLLVALGLWLPFVYSLAFLLVFSISSLSFNSFAQKIYFVGLGVTTVLGVSFAIFWKVSHRATAVSKSAKQPNKPRAYSHKIDKKDENSRQNVDNDDVLDNVREYSDNKSVPSDNNGELDKKYLASSANSAGENRQNIQNSQNSSNIQNIQNSQNSQNIQNSQRDEANCDLGADELWARLMGSGDSEKSERPLVFATRTDPKIFIYEYNNRLEYWKKGLLGMTYLGMEYKNTKTEKPKNNNTY